MVLHSSRITKVFPSLGKHFTCHPHCCQRHRRVGILWCVAPALGYVEPGGPSRRSGPRPGPAAESQHQAEGAAPRRQVGAVWAVRAGLATSAPGLQLGRSLHRTGGRGTARRAGPSECHQGCPRPASSPPGEPRGALAPPAAPDVCELPGRAAQLRHEEAAFPGLLLTRPQPLPPHCAAGLLRSGLIIASLREPALAEGKACLEQV